MYENIVLKDMNKFIEVRRGSEIYDYFNQKSFISVK